MNKITTPYKIEENLDGNLIAITQEGTQYHLVYLGEDSDGNEIIKTANGELFITLSPEDYQMLIQDAENYHQCNKDNKKCAKSNFDANNENEEHKNIINTQSKEIELLKEKLEIKDDEGHPLLVDTMCISLAAGLFALGKAIPKWTAEENFTYRPDAQIQTGDAFNILGKGLMVVGALTGVFCTIDFGLNLYNGDEL